MYHLVVKALAGTGKTTTLIEGLKRLTTGKGTEGFLPSVQQEAIFNAMRDGQEEGVGSGSVRFLAFNKSIASELGKRMPEGCSASTMHSLGLKAVMSAFGETLGKRAVTSWKVSNVIEQVTGTDSRELRLNKREYFDGLCKLTDMCRLLLLGFDEEEEEEFDPYSLSPELLDEVCAKYDINLNGSREKVYETLPEVLQICADPERMDKPSIDFTDMVWLPVVNQLQTEQFDLVLVDEAQDLNPCQQALVLSAGRRVIVCGDPKQAIYGFAGADTSSMDSLRSKLLDRGEVTELPLTITYRCGKEIVRLAQEIVPEYEAYEGNGPGSINTILGEEYRDGVGSPVDGDMVLCRTNAPLVSSAFQFIKNGKKAVIQGGDIGKGLISLIKKMKAGQDVGTLLSKIQEWHERESMKVAKLKYGGEARLIALADKKECIEAFSEDALTVPDVIENIQKMFVDNDQEGIIHSSIHRAKGLESYRVFILRGDLIPHPMAKTENALEQEYNLKYVSITRAIENLVYVREEEK